MAWWTWGPLTGALVKLIPAKVVNVSRHGCLLETSSPLPAGAVGSLEIERGGQKHVEAIRVCRTAERPGGTLPFCAGSEFLILDAASASSIRHQAARLERKQAPSRLADTGENSVSDPTTSKVLPRQDVDGDGAISRDFGDLYAP